MPENPVIVNILGVEYPVRGEFDPDHIRRIADNLNQRMSELMKYQKVKSNERTAIFTALNLEDELFSVKQDTNEVISKLSGKIQKLIDRLDNELSNESLED